MAYNVGDRKIVIKNSNKHKFKCGTKIEIVIIPDKTSYLCGRVTNSQLEMNSTWYFIEHDDLSSLTDILKKL